MRADATRAWDWPERYDLTETTRLLRTGGNDPSLRREADGLWRAARFPSGPSTVRVAVREGEELVGWAWGPGAEEALAALPGLLGFERAPWALPPHPVVDRWARAHPGLRLTDTGNVWESLVVVVLQQLVTWMDAAHSWRLLLERVGEPAPGPADLRVPPTPAAVRALGVEGTMQLGVDRRRARTLQELAFGATRLQRAADLPTDEAAAFLEQVPGIGPWTSSTVLGTRLGRPEPLVRGDVHVPHAACWALAGEPRGTDERMAELLAPFPGEAFRVLRLLFATRIAAPRRAPRRRARFGRRF